MVEFLQALSEIHASLSAWYSVQGIRILNALAIYFFSVNSFYILLIVLAIFSMRRRRALKPFMGHLDTLGFSPATSILAPAYNEEKSIVDSVKALLGLRYSQYEVIVINDGSKDQTLALMLEHFALYESFLPRWTTIGKGEIRGTYRSKNYPNLIVLDKKNSGKADSLNCAIDYTSTEIFCAVDSDSLLETDSLVAVTAPFLEDPTTIASGGTIRVVNGNKVENSRVIERGFPVDFLARIQFLEYIRAFFCGRVGWNELQSTLIISGAFGAFRKETVIQVGGYKTDSLGEDMDLVVRLHVHCRENKIPYKIVFLPEPVCWTEVPSDWATLRKQRRRWTIGLVQVLAKNIRMLLNPKYGAVGFIGFPYFILVEVMSPFFEFAAVGLLFMGIALGAFSGFTEILLFVTSIFYGAVVTFAAAVIDESYDEGRPHDLNMFQVFLYSVLENFGFRQLHALWRIEGVFHSFRKENQWGSMKRAGLGPTTKPSTDKSKL